MAAVGPAFAGFATVAICWLLIYLLTGQTRIDIVGEPTTAEWIVLAIAALTLPLAAAVGWLAARLTDNLARAAVSTAAVAVMVAAVAVDGDAPDLVVTSS